jgi:hypothetical protein
MGQLLGRLWGKVDDEVDDEEAQATLRENSEMNGGGGGSSITLTEMKMPEDDEKDAVSFQKHWDEGIFSSSGFATVKECFANPRARRKSAAILDARDNNHQDEHWQLTGKQTAEPLTLEPTVSVASNADDNTTAASSETLSTQVTTPRKKQQKKKQPKWKLSVPHGRRPHRFAHVIADQRTMIAELNSRLLLLSAAAILFTSVGDL